VTFRARRKENACMRKKTNNSRFESLDALCSLSSAASFRRFSLSTTLSMYPRDSVIRACRTVTGFPDRWCFPVVPVVPVVSHRTRLFLSKRKRTKRKQERRRKSRMESNRLSIRFVLSSRVELLSSSIDTVNRV